MYDIVCNCSPDTPVVLLVYPVVGVSDWMSLSSGRRSS